MKRTVLLLLAVPALMLAGPGWGLHMNKTNIPLTVWVASDLHYLSPALVEDADRLAQVMGASDGKMADFSPPIVEAFLSRVMEEKPAALIIPGDLTFNGEMQSLADIVSMLEDVRRAGITVLVIPGNHDIAYPLARKFGKDGLEYTENISQAGFAATCGPLGYDAAASRDKGSFSYLYDLAEDVHILMLDGNTETAPGAIGADTLAWAETVAGRARGLVISVTHQNVLKQNPLLWDGFILKNADETAKALRRAGVFLNFSGHSHILHDSREAGLTDAAVSSLTVSPMNYLVVEIDEARNVTYAPAQVDIRLPEAAARFRRTTESQARALTDGLGIPEDIRLRMTEFAAALNETYFANANADMAPFRSDPRRALWQTYGAGTFWCLYIDSMLDDAETN